MKTLQMNSKLIVCGIATVGLALVTGASRGSAIWNGPTITFTHNAATGELVDHLTTGVSLTRGSFGGLYNTPAESGATPGISPSDTKWAVGSLANYNTLSYGACPLEAGNHPPGDVNKTYVVHLVAEDIYFSLTLTAWGGVGGAGDKSFTYVRSTPTPPTPTVTITNPASGAVFAAPASVGLGASAAVSSGTMTNVQFFTNGVVLGSVLTTPFTLTANNLAAGAYALKAVATAAGISATSAVVNVSVVNPVAVSLAGAGITNGQFIFSSTANAGLSYVLQSSTNLQSWVSLLTNVAAGSPVLFTNPVTSTGLKFYRVGRLPNP
jgi:hypothetical protein